MFVRLKSVIIPGASTRIKLNQNDCAKCNIIHELLHVLGFYHIHIAADHDNYININFNNIRTDRKNNFDKITRDVSMFNTVYEYRVKFCRSYLRF